MAGSRTRQSHFSQQHQGCQQKTPPSPPPSQAPGLPRKSATQNHFYTIKSVFSGQGRAPNAVGSGGSQGIAGTAAGLCGELAILHWPCP